MYSKADVKRLVKDYAGDLIINHKIELTTTLKPEIKADIYQRIPNLNNLVNAEISSVYNSLQEKADLFNDKWTDLSLAENKRQKHSKKEIVPHPMKTRSKTKHDDD